MFSVEVVRVLDTVLYVTFLRFNQVCKHAIAHVCFYFNMTLALPQGKRFHSLHTS